MRIITITFCERLERDIFSIFEGKKNWNGDVMNSLLVSNR